MSSALEQLPNELLDWIISYLATEPPSLTRFHQPPHPQFTRSRARNLKHLALSSSHLLHLVRPRLFTHVCLELENESDFLAFIRRSRLGRYVTSLVAITVNASADQGWWHRVLRDLDPACVTVLASPTFIGNMLNTWVEDRHSLEFDMKLQILQLRRQSPLPNLSQPLDLDNCKSLLETHRWTSMSFNESSSLNAYTHDQYFLLRVPSFMGKWGVELSPQKTFEYGVQLSPLKSPYIKLPLILHGLTYFSYTAVFPFYNHVQLVLDALALMPDLRVLSLQLAPDADRITEDDHCKAMERTDPWTELSTAYNLIGFEVNAKYCLVEFRTGDYHLEAIDFPLSRILQQCLGDWGWAQESCNVWKRIPSRTWEVVEFVDVRLQDGKLWYKARWAEVDDDNWYPAEDFKYQSPFLFDFHESHPDKPGPPVRLPLWMDAGRRDAFIRDHPDDGTPARLGLM